MSFENESLELGNIEDDYSLESILAEYKGSAFIKGSSRMSREELEKQAREIIEEYTGKTGNSAETVSAIPTAQDKPQLDSGGDNTVESPVKPRRGELVKREVTEEKEQKKKTGVEKGIRDVEEKRKRVSAVEEKQTLAFSHRELTEDEQEFFGVGKYSANLSDEEKTDVENTIENERRNRAKRREKKLRAKKAAAEVKEKKAEENSSQQHRELSAAEARRVYGFGIASLRMRTFAVLAICISLCCFTCLGDTVFTNRPQLANVLLSCGLLVVALLAGDILVGGAAGAFRGKFSAETLAVASAVFACADAVFQIVTGSGDYGMPYCAVAAVSISGTMWGTLKGRKAYNMTFKMAAQTKVPTVVTAEWEKVDEGAVITKNLGSAKGFVDKSIETDLAENVYNRLAPLFLVLSVVAAAICAHINGKAAFIHCLSGIVATTAAFGSLMIFNQPFYVAVKNLFNHGAAIAGWKGACDVKRSVGMVVKDLDIFPENCMTINGLKIVSPMPEEKVIAYTGSLVVASGAGTSKIFAELMREYACSLYRVEEFACYESGGIGAYIKGSKVWVGSAAFMNLMGIRLPQNLDIKNAVFSAIDGELAGVFIINYQPSDAVQSALLNMIHSKITPIFAIRDFNVTPALVRNKFKLPLNEGEFTSFAARYELSQNSEQTASAPAALMSREGINHYTEIVRCGRRIVTATKCALGITLAGIAIGMLLLIMMFAAGSFAAASAAHVLTYMLLWAVAEYLIATF